MEVNQQSQNSIKSWWKRVSREKSLEAIGLKSGKKNLTIKAVGLFIGILFLASGGISFYLSIFKYNDEFIDIVTNPSVSFSLIVGLFFTVTSRFNNIAVKVIHIICLIIAGLLTVDSSGLSMELHGEFIIILSVMIMRSYGLVTRKYKTVLVSSIISCFLIRLIQNYSEIIIEPEKFLYYSILIMFFTVFFTIVLESETAKVAQEASNICQQWTKEQVYNDIGRSVFSTFMHDYHIDHAIAHIETIDELLSEGYIEHSRFVLNELKKMLEDDCENITRIKEKIRLSERDKPEVLDVFNIVLDRVKHYKKLYNIKDSEISFNSDIDDKYKIKMIPIDFSGILENLLRNAVEASSNDRRIDILLFIDHNYATLTIINSGEPIPWREKDGRVPVESFRVGRTTKKSGSGWGVYSIIKRVYANNGEVNITSGPEGTRFSINLPVIKVHNSNAISSEKFTLSGVI